MVLSNAKLGTKFRNMLWIALTIHCVPGSSRNDIYIRHFDH